MANAIQDELQNNTVESPKQNFELLSQWGNIDVLYCQTLNENWRQYINYLDKEVKDIVS